MASDPLSLTPAQAHLSAELGALRAEEARMVTRLCDIRAAIKAKEASILRLHRQEASKDEHSVVKSEHAVVKPKREPMDKTEKEKDVTEKEKEKKHHVDAPGPTPRKRGRPGKDPTEPPKKYYCRITGRCRRCTYIDRQAGGGGAHTKDERCDQGPKDEKTEKSADSSSSDSSDTD